MSDDKYRHEYSPKKDDWGRIGEETRRWHEIWGVNLFTAPASYSSTMTGSETFTNPSTAFVVYFLDPGGSNRNFNPSGTFQTGFIAFVKNIATAGNGDITFDSAASAQVVQPGQLGYVCMTARCGGDMKKLYLILTVPVSAATYNKFVLLSPTDTSADVIQPMDSNKNFSVTQSLIADSDLSYISTEGVFLGDGNTGFYEVSDNVLATIVGGSEIAKADALVYSVGTRISSDGSVTADKGQSFGNTSGFMLGDGNTGWYENADNDVRLAVAGTDKITSAYGVTETKDTEIYQRGYSHLILGTTSGNAHAGLWIFGPVIADQSSGPAGAFTLTSGAAATYESNGACSSLSASKVVWSPTSANAAGEVGAGTMWISAMDTNGFTITHANNGETDRTFDYIMMDIGDASVY